MFDLVVPLQSPKTPSPSKQQPVKMLSLPYILALAAYSRLSASLPSKSQAHVQKESGGIDPAFSPPSANKTITANAAVEIIWV